jgi:hypothetical protein
MTSRDGVPRRLDQAPLYFGAPPGRAGSTSDVLVLGRPGRAWGRQRRRQRRVINRLLALDGWRSMYAWEGRLLDRAGALLEVEEAYHQVIAGDPALQQWLCGFADVYDNARSNTASGCDHAVQEQSSLHFADIAIRRVMLRLGLRFSGRHRLSLRVARPDGHDLAAAAVPFHRPEAILQPRIEGWWEPGSIQDFWQSNEVLVATPRGIAEFARASAELYPFEVLYVNAATLPPPTRALAPGHAVFHAVHGLGRVSDRSDDGDEMGVRFHNGQRRPRRFGAGADESVNVLRDAERLTTLASAMAAGEPLDRDDCRLLARHLTPLSPSADPLSGEPWEGIWLEGKAIRNLADCLRQTLITAPSLSTRHYLVKSLLTDAAVPLEFGHRFGNREITSHLDELQAEMDPAIDLCAALGHHQSLELLGRLATVHVSRARYEGSYNPAGYSKIRLSIQDQALRALTATVGRFVKSLER